jgi:formate hydrogenlyase subunit 3/multisubunit Na+/H+ antiporter MnhD subunit
MLLLLLALAVLGLGGVAALLAGGSPRLATRLGVGGAVLGGLLGVVPTAAVLLGAPVPSVHAPWPVPYASLSLELDALSAVFLLPIFGLSAIAAVFGGEYLARAGERRSLGPPWCAYDLLVASMALAVVARNAVLFLVAWEVMALTSFLLVAFEDESDAGWVYLVATHLGTACLLGLFLLLGRGEAVLDFDRFTLPPGGVALPFLLALVGFGAKAGIMPLHVWLPEAHPAAPSHVSAVMSGVMTATGFYGLLRVSTLLGPLPPWCGWTLVGVGLVSSVLGVLLALAQPELKRLLAYSTVENAGLVALGLGLGFLGRSANAPAVALLAFAGAFVHILLHAAAKGLLFLGAGAVLHATGTARLDRLGGLLRAMPWTGATVLVGALTLCGLPPLGGFVSELLIFLGALRAASGLGAETAVPALVVIAGLALTGGLAAACMTGAFGVAFLGQARSDAAARAHDAGPAMRLPLCVLAAACVLLALLGPWIVGALAPVLAVTTGLAADVVRGELTAASAPLRSIVGACLAIFLVAAGLAALRLRLLAGRPVAAAATWGCGYAAPSTRMQYTASSFVQPLTEVFGTVLGTRRRVSPPTGLFPQRAALATETPDPWRDRVYAPLFAGVARGAATLHWLQHGRLQLYVLYIAVTLLVLLVWFGP